MKQFLNLQSGHQLLRQAIDALALLASFGAMALFACGDGSGNDRTTQETEKAISFKSYRNLIFVPVRINGSKPISFVLDSGSGNGILDRARAKELGLKLEKGG